MADVNPRLASALADRYRIERELGSGGMATVYLAGDDRITLLEAFGEAYPIPDDQVPQDWKDINTQKRDKGKWWDRRVDITSGEKPAVMTACSEPPTAR